MVKRPLKFFEYSGILNQIGLHLWSDLLVELEFFDDEVEVVAERLLNILSDIIIQRWLNMIWLVRLFDFFDPHVEGVQFLLNKVIKVV